MRRVRLKFAMGVLNSHAPRIFEEPDVQLCLVCDPRVKPLFDALRQHAVRSHCFLPVDSIS